MMIRKSLKINVSGQEDQLSVGYFLSVVSRAVRLLSIVDCAKTGDRLPSMAWQITDASMKSPLTLTISGYAKKGKDEIDVIDPFLRGLQKIEKGSTRPEFFTDDALEIARDIGALRNHFSVLSFSANGVKVSPTQHISANVDTIIGGSGSFYFSEDMQIEGRLEALSVHPPPDFRIWEVLTNRPVRCLVSEDEVDELIPLIRSRVRVTGKTKYNKKNFPVSVEVASIERLPEQRELPQIEDLHRADIDITGGQDSVDFIRDLRDE